MIVAMKKVSLIMQSKYAPHAIERVRELGLLHIQHQQVPQARTISSLKNDIRLIDEALSILFEAESFRGMPQEAVAALKDWRLAGQHIIDLRKRLDHLEEYSKALINRISQWEKWGDFDPEKISRINEKGIFIGLYRIPVKELKRLPKEVIVKKVFSQGGIAGCLIISRGKTDIGYKELPLPESGLSDMRARLLEDNRVMEGIKDDLYEAISCRKGLLQARSLIEQDLEFHQALNGMGVAGSIQYVRGYIPYDTVQPLLDTAKKERWGISITDPSATDQVPTLIRNPRWISIIAPIFKMIEVVPGYRELDISLFFLIFFSIFFGMLIGDAGYGMIFFLLTVLARRKWGAKLKGSAVFILFYILSFCAIIWGLLSGTFFGQEWLPASMSPLVPALRDSKNVQALCFLLGAIHLTIAHLWHSIIKLPSLSALADIGWVLILWAAFFLARMLILAEPLAPLAKWLVIAGAGLVVLFTSPQRNVFKGIAAGSGQLLLNLINSFTDIVSYIRLFAVGLATVAVADTFNKMAQEVGFGSFFAGLAACLVILLGHALNIMLGPMAVLVHGVRLNVLEFCSHLNIQWSGFSYNPLRKK